LTRHADIDAVLVALVTTAVAAAATPVGWWELGHPSYRTIKGILIAGTETDPEPETSGDAGAATFLDGPARLFATVAAPDETDDDQVHDEAEVEAR
jgi:hypothetical protein